MRMRQMVVLARAFGCALACLIAMFGNRAVAQAPEATLVFDTELLSMDLVGHGVPLPVGPGWSQMLTDVVIGRWLEVPSLGQARAWNGQQPGNGPPLPIDPEVLDGALFQVDSFFDVFFDITITDVDPQVNMRGLQDGSSLHLVALGPAHLATTYSALFDKDAPSFGLLPPPGISPYLWFGKIEAGLDLDLDGNGDPDELVVLSLALTLMDQNRTFIVLPDGTVINNVDAALTLNGAIQDELADPPFSFDLTGPTAASSHLVNPVEPGGQVPEPGVGLLGLAMAAAVPFALRRCGRA